MTRYIFGGASPIILSEVVELCSNFCWRIVSIGFGVGGFCICFVISTTAATTAAVVIIIVTIIAIITAFATAAAAATVTTLGKGLKCYSGYCVCL